MSKKASSKSSAVQASDPPQEQKKVPVLSEILQEYYVGEKLIDLRRVKRHSNCRPLRDYGVQRLSESLASQGYLSSKHTFMVIEGVDYLPWANEHVPLLPTMKTSQELLNEYSPTAESLGVMFDGGHMGAAILKSKAQPALYMAKTYKPMPLELLVTFMYALNDASSSVVDFSLFDRLMSIRSLARVLKPAGRPFATSDAVFTKTVECGLQLKRPTINKYHSLAVNLSEEAWSELSSMWTQSPDVGVQLNNLYMPPFTHSAQAEHHLPMLERLKSFRTTNGKSASVEEGKTLYSLYLKGSTIVRFFKKRLAEHQIPVKQEWENKCKSILKTVTYDGQLEASSSTESLIPCLSAIALFIKKNLGPDILKAPQVDAVIEDEEEEKNAEEDNHAPDVAAVESNKRKADALDLPEDDHPLPPVNPAIVEDHVLAPVAAPPLPGPAETILTSFKKKYLLRQSRWQEFTDDECLFNTFKGKVDLVLTDPPYNVFPVPHDKISDADYPAFAKVVYQLLQEAGTVVLFCSWQQAPYWSKALGDAGLVVNKSLLTIVYAYSASVRFRNNGMIQNASQTALVAHKDNGKAIKHMTNHTAISTRPAYVNVIDNYTPPHPQRKLYIKVDGKKVVARREEKNPVLAIELIKRYTNADAKTIVFDAFGGTFAFGLAAVELGVQYVGLEPDEAIFNDATKRMINHFERREQSGQPLLVIASTINEVMALVPAHYVEGQGSGEDLANWTLEYDQSSVISKAPLKKDDVVCGVWGDAIFPASLDEKIDSSGNTVLFVFQSTDRYVRVKKECVAFHLLNAEDTLESNCRVAESSSPTLDWKFLQIIAVNDIEVGDKIVVDWGDRIYISIPDDVLMNDE